MRRVLVVGLVVVGLLAGAAAVGWFVWLPGYRPGLRTGELYGIDVSAHQGSIDWPRLKGERLAFVYIKATEGADHVDMRFARNWAGADQAGLRKGAYHFFTLCSPGDDQAGNFLHTVPLGSADLAPVIDLELRGNCSARPTRPALLRELRTFVRRVETATERKVVLYLGEEFQRRYHVRAALQRPVWVRSILRRPSGDWVIWQVHGRARITGIDGPADLDVMHAG